MRALSELGHPPKELRTITCVRNLDADRGPPAPRPHVVPSRSPVRGAFSFWRLLFCRTVQDGFLPLTQKAVPSSLLICADAAQSGGDNGSKKPSIPRHARNGSGFGFASWEQEGICQIVA
jgi:hypothetical protein